MLTPTKKHPIQLKATSNLLLDLGKMVTGTFVIGFFVPSLEFSFISFLGGLIIAGGFFYSGLASLRLLEE